MKGKKVSESQRPPPEDKRIAAVNQKEGLGTRILKSLRLSVSSIESKESARTELMPAADVNLGLTEEERENMTSAQLGDHYKKTNVGESNKKTLGNEPLSHSFAHRLNEDERIAAEDMSRKIFIRKKAREKWCKRGVYLLLVLTVVGVLAVLVFIVFEDQIDFGNDNNSSRLPLQLFLGKLFNSDLEYTCLSLIDEFDGYSDSELEGNYIFGVCLSDKVYVVCDMINGLSEELYCDDICGCKQNQLVELTYTDYNQDDNFCEDSMYSNFCNGLF